MAEVATIARPYAEALFKSLPQGSRVQAADELDALTAVIADPQMRRYADDPKVADAQALDLLTSVVAQQRGAALSAPVANLLGMVVENRRLAALPELAAQFKALVNLDSGVSEATIHSAFDIDPAQLPEVVAALEKRFGRRLTAHVVRDAGLIGGIRVVVGDEVLDTSVKARLDQMRAALTA